MKDDAASEYFTGRKNKDESEGKGCSSGKSGTSGSEQIFPLLPLIPVVSVNDNVSDCERRDDEKEFSSWNDQARPPKRFQVYATKK